MPQLPFTVKASFQGYFTWLGYLRPFVALVLLGFLVWVNGWYGLTAIALIVVLLGLAAVLLKQRKVVATEMGIVFKNAVGKTTKVTYDDIKVVHVVANYFDSGFGIIPRVFIEKNDGSRFAALNTVFYPVKGVDQLLSVFRAKKIEMPYYKDIIQAKQFYEVFPGLSTYSERHPFFVATMIVVGILAAVTMFVVFTR